MECPICGQKFTESSKLNIHLDNNHSESGLDGITSFFGKFFQRETITDILPLVTFELNENAPDLMPSGLSDIDFERFMSLKTKGKRLYNLSEFINKDHWETGNVEICRIEDCDKPLGILNGRQNCYRCGKQVCLDHSKFQLKLAGDAKHDPINGIWARACWKCFTTKEGYRSNHGVVRNRMKDFLQLRNYKVSQTLMESNKIELRLRRLTKQLTSSPFSSPILPKKVLKLLGHDSSASVVEWVPDESESKCQRCKSDFTLLFRKHHCRLCGSIICSNCSRNLEIFEEITVRVCKQCDYLLTLRKREASAFDMTLYNLYEPIQRIKLSVLQNLEKFKALMTELNQRTLIHRSDQDYITAVKLRTLIIDQFSDIDHQAKKIKALPSALRNHLIIQDNILRGVLLFLQRQMFSLQHMPTVKIAHQSEIIDVLTDSITQLNMQLQMATKVGNEEEIEALSLQIKELERELAQKI